MVIKILKNKIMPLPNLDLDKYRNLLPLNGRVVIKDITKLEKSPIKYAGERESRAYAVVVAVPKSLEESLLGKMIVFNEYEGQELYKMPGVVDEDDLLVIRESDIILIINTD